LAVGVGVGVTEGVGFGVTTGAGVDVTALTVEILF
jgi:hypothetical protein